MIRLLIVEDQPAICQGLTMRLAAEADFTVIGEASTCETALGLAVSLHPDVVLIDVDMLSMDSFEIVRALRTVSPQAAPILLSVHDDVSIRARAESAGAADLVVKSLPAETLLLSIRKAVYQPDRTFP